MARLPRIVVPGLPHHVIQRGNNRQAVFFAAQDYGRYLDSLRSAADHYRCAIHAFVLMTNHVHLVITPNNMDGMSRLMQSIGRRYVRFINDTYRRSGTLWEGRFKSAVIDSERYLLTCMRYIELNPVRAGIVETPGDYRWSSFAINASARTTELITPHLCYQTLGNTNAERAAVYCSLFEQPLESDALTRIRNATERGDVIGHQPFRDQIAATLGRGVKKLAHGGDRKSRPFRESRSSSTLTP
jgi:putative transposase